MSFESDLPQAFRGSGIEKDSENNKKEVEAISPPPLFHSIE